ncbi:MAG TPA: M20 aminoacylase family protein [Casimicrobiaceae bacterium]|nr:M20 aminoacylase family protein [Casimicrobiaceae bacterium]
MNPVEHLRKDHAELTALRRDLHAHPELGFEEHRTAEIVARELEAAGVEHHRGIGRTGVVGVIRGACEESGRAVGLRADMDALPMHEENDFPHASRFKGRMHGCGHDGHTIMLLGAARYLARTRRFDGTVYLIFQPGEEGFAGGKAMVDDGLFERFPADEIYALHNWPALPAGQIGLRPGPMMAAADRIEIHIEGRGGHGAHPHMTVDPVLVAGHIITATQSIVARNVSPLDTAVVSLCAMHSGNLAAMSVVPREARLVGTVRTFRPETQDRIERRLTDLVHSIAAGFGATATLKYERVYPATVNTEREAEFAAEVADALVGRENVVRDLEPSMGSEDFSFMLQQRPGAYARLGQGGAEGGCFLHNSRYDFNDEVIPLGAGYLAALAEAALPLQR